MQFKGRNIVVAGTTSEEQRPLIEGKKCFWKEFFICSDIYTVRCTNDPAWKDTDRKYDLIMEMLWSLFVSAEYESLTLHDILYNKQQESKMHNHI